MVVVDVVSRRLDRTTGAEWRYYKVLLLSLLFMFKHMTSIFLNCIALAYNA